MPKNEVLTIKLADTYGQEKTLHLMEKSALLRFRALIGELQERFEALIREL